MGWTRWPPETVMSTPIPQLLLAIDGCVDVAIKTHPFAKQEPEHTPVKELDRRKVRKGVADGFRSMMKERRGRKKKR